MPPRAKVRTPFAERLSKIRMAKGITQDELSRMTKISSRVVALYETTIKNPTPDIVVRLANALKVSVDELMGHKTLRIKDPVTRKAMKNAKLIQELQPKDQDTVLHLIRTLHPRRKKT